MEQGGKPHVSGAEMIEIREFITWERTTRGASGTNYLNGDENNKGGRRYDGKDGWDLAELCQRAREAIKMKTGGPK